MFGTLRGRPLPQDGPGYLSQGRRQAGQVPDYLSSILPALFVKQLLVHSVFSTCAIGTLGLTCSICTNEETKAGSSGDLRWPVQCLFTAPRSPWW